MKHATTQAVTAFIFMVFAFLTHESAHLITAKLLGNTATMSINHVVPANGAWSSTGAATLITAAGPALTIFLGCIGFVWAVSRSSLLGLNILLVAFAHRALATIVSLNNPNDEMRVSLDLGLGPWTLPVVVSSTLLALSAIAIARTRPGYWRLAGVWIGASVALILVVFGEPFLPVLTW